MPKTNESTSNHNVDSVPRGGYSSIAFDKQSKQSRYSFVILTLKHLLQIKNIYTKRFLTHWDDDIQDYKIKSNQKYFFVQT